MTKNPSTTKPRTKLDIFEEYATRGGTKKIKSFDSTADLIKALDALPPLPVATPEPTPEPAAKKQPVAKDDFVLDDEAIDVPAPKQRKAAKPAKQPKAPKDPNKKRNPNTQARVNKLVAHSEETYKISPSFNREARMWEFRSGRKIVAQCDSRKLAEFTVDFEVYAKWIKARTREATAP